MALVWTQSEPMLREVSASPLRGPVVGAVEVVVELGVEATAAVESKRPRLEVGVTPALHLALEVGAGAGAAAAVPPKLLLPSG